MAISTNTPGEVIEFEDIGARVYNDANISIPNNTLTTLTFNSERWDTDGIHEGVTNPDRLTCQTAGKYVIHATIEYAASNAGNRVVALYVNATNIVYVTYTATQTLASRYEVSAIYDLDVDDYVTCQVYQTSGGALNVVSAANRSPEFAMQLIAEA